MKIKILITVFLFFSFISISSSQSLVLSSDTNNVMIGDWVTLNLQYLSGEKKEVVFPIFDATQIEGLELIDETRVDTVKNGKSFGLSKRFTVSAYDSGSFVIPRMAMLFEKNGTIDTLYSDSLILKFNSPAVDTTQAIKDIKGIFNINYSDNSLLYWIGGVVILLLIVAALIYYFKNRKNKEEKEEIEYDPSIPPYILAMESLRRIEQERLWQNGYFKKYYTEITDVLRIYYHRIYSIKTKELTSRELIEALHGKTLFDNESVTMLEYISRYSDLSKFAKANPLPENNTQSLKYAFELVEKGKQLSDKVEGGENVQ